MYENTDKYNDIINLPHHVSKKHPQMSLKNHSAQFAPFAALTGHEEAVKETGRLTSERIEITEDMKQVLDNKLQIIQDKISLKPKVTITYFVPDLKKDGGKYLTVTGNIKRIDKDNLLIFFDNRIEINILDIIKISGDIFEQMD